MKMLRLLLTGMAIFVVSTVVAQTASNLKGTVVGTEGKALPGATVELINSTGQIIAQTSSNSNGIFELSGLQNSSSYKLRVKMLGYNNYETDIKTSSQPETKSMLVRLEEQTSDLDEVVVIGYGQQKKGDLTTAVSSLNNVDEQVARPLTNVSEMLQGNVAGITVMSSGGDPSKMPSVMIRGMGTLNAESPLYVVDGMPYYGGPINPNDIESVSILKDAASAAIYGAQAASGVIVITTKSGKSGAPRVQADVYRGWQTASNLPTALNAVQYSNVYNTAAKNDGIAGKPGHDAALNPWGQETRTNWIEEIFQTGNILNSNVQVSGGSEKSKYSSSFGYHDKEGLLLNTGYKRFSYRLKSEFEFFDRLTVGQNFYLNHLTALGTNTESSYSGSIINAIYMNPAAPVYDENGLFHGTVPFNLSGFSGTYGDTYNPVALLLRPRVHNPQLNINGNAFIKVDILDGLSFKSNFGVNLDRDSYKRFDPKIPEIGRANGNNYLTHSEANENRWIWDQQLNYTKQFGAHNLDLVAVYSAQHTRYDYYYVQGMGFEREDEWYQYIGNASSIPKLPTSSVYEDALTSAIGRANYNYDNRYFLSASIRQDRTSRLSANNRSDVFPSVSAAWKISSEPFFNVSLVNDLKIRASWGQIGNIQSVDAYAFNLPLNTGMVTPLGSEGALVRHFALTTQPNPNLIWERSESFDVGLDMTIANKLTLTADFYRKKTLGMILANQPDPHIGMTAVAPSNVGDVLNQGFEATLKYQDQVGDVNFNVQGNLGINDNKVLNIDGYYNSSILHGDHVRGTLLPYRSTKGQPLYSYNLIKSAGIFQSQEEINAHAVNGELIQKNAKPGDLKFIDLNGDGKINDDDRQYMGSAVPKFTYGFSLNMNYKKFDLNVLTYGVSGSKIFNGYKFSAYNAGLQGYNLDSRVLNAWSEENRNTDIPRLSNQDPNGNFGTISDWYLENGDFFRIKNITLGYSLPNFVGNLSSRIYLSAENLFTATKYSGIDPEVGRIGLDVANYPVAKTYSIGINVNF